MTQHVPVALFKFQIEFLGSYLVISKLHSDSEDTSS